MDWQTYIQHREATEADGIVGLDFRTPRHWFALFAISGREQKAADWLREAHVRAYWPNYFTADCVGAQGNGRSATRWRLRALIPGYIFIAVRQGTADPALGDLVNETPGLIGYLRNGEGYAAPLTEKDIQDIRAIEGDQNRPPPAKHVHNFKTGQKVRFKSASGWVGKIMQFCNDGRIAIGVPLLGRIAPVKALPHQIEGM